MWACPKCTTNRKDVSAAICVVIWGGGLHIVEPRRKPDFSIDRHWNTSSSYNSATPKGRLVSWRQSKQSNVRTRVWRTSLYFIFSKHLYDYYCIKWAILNIFIFIYLRLLTWVSQDIEKVHTKKRKILTHASNVFMHKLDLIIFYVLWHFHAELYSFYVCLFYVWER